LFYKPFVFFVSFVVKVIWRLAKALLHTETRKVKWLMN